MLTELMDNIPSHVMTDRFNSTNGSLDYSYNSTNGSLDYSDIPMVNGNILNRPEIIVTMILGIVSILANLGSFLAIQHIQGPWNANIRLIISLCASDMLVSITVLTQVSYRHSSSPISIQETGRHSCISLMVRCLRMMAHAMSLLNLIGLALDHYCAILKPLNHSSLMSCRRINIMIAIFWIVSLLLSLSDFVIPYGQYSFCEDSNPINYCDDVLYCSTYENEYLIFVLTVISFTIIVALYIAIFMRIHNNQSFHERHVAHVRQNYRGLITTILILVTFAICWLPYCLFEVIITIKASIDVHQVLYYWWLVAKYDYYLYNLLLLNSVCDPVIYAIRMKEVQAGYRNLIKKCSHGYLYTHQRQSSRERQSSRRSTSVMKLETSGWKQSHDQGEGYQI